MGSSLTFSSLAALACVLAWAYIYVEANVILLWCGDQGERLPGPQNGPFRIRGPGQPVDEGDMT
jgi:hypothetical protein